MKEVGQFPVQLVLIRACKRHVLEIEDRAGIAVKGAGRMPPQFIEQHRAKAVHIRMPAQLLQLSGLLLQRRKALSIGSSHRFLLRQIRHGDHRIEVKQLHQVGGACDGQDVFRFEIEIEIAGLMNPLHNPARAGQQQDTFLEARAAMVRQRLAV